jgi:hypothetical protein
LAKDWQLHLCVLRHEREWLLCCHCDRLVVVTKRDCLKLVSIRTQHIHNSTKLAISPIAHRDMFFSVVSKFVCIGVTLISVRKSYRGYIRLASRRSATRWLIHLDVRKRGIGASAGSFAASAGEASASAAGFKHILTIVRLVKNIAGEDLSKPAIFFCLLIK